MTPSDDDFSGVDAERIEYQQLLSDAEAGKFDIVLCKHQSRFTRDMEHVEHYIHDKFQEWGIRFISLLDGADTDVQGNKKSRQINGLVNEWYLEDLSNNVRTSQKVRKADGKYVGSSFPYGYQKDPLDVNRLIVDPIASTVVRRIFDMYEHGSGAERISTILNQEGIPCPSRYKMEVLGMKFNNYLLHRYQDRSDREYSMWASSSIFMILRNETYTGGLAQNRTNTISYKNQKRIKNRKEDWIRCDGTHEPIITREQFETIQAIRQSRTRPGISGKKYLLSGMLRCSQCGSNLIISSVRGDHKYYGCHYHRINPKACEGINVSEKVISDAVLGQLKAYLTGLDEEKITAHIRVKMRDGGQPDMLKKQWNVKLQEIERIDLVVKQLYMDRVMGLISPEQFNQLNQSYTADQVRLKQEAEDLKRTLAELDVHQKMIEKTIADKLAIISIARKYINAEVLTRDMVLELIEYIKVAEAEGHGKKSIEIHWKF